MVSGGDLAHVAAGVAAVACVILFIWVKCFKKRKRNRFEKARVNNLENGVSRNQELIASLHEQAAVMESGRRRPSLQGFRRGGSTRPLFSWADNPSLMTDAVESGWARFAFTLSPSVRPTSILGMCAASEGFGGALETEITWEIGHGSLDFMQKIRLNPGTRRSGLNSYSSSNSSPLTVIRTALPLPGPACAFPQEAYFEIIMLSCREEDEIESIKIREGERMKLIKESDGNEHRSSDSSFSTTGARDEGRLGAGESLVAVGFTVGCHLPMKIPGSYPGSIGFASGGSVYHLGNKVMADSEKAEWGMLTGKVIGCGFVPSQRKVFFTIDSELVHTINCTTDEFGAPLYPTLAATCDITVLVNNGQSAFKYVPANATRRANPCFLGSSCASGTFCEDSRELFSMGRIDSQWLTRSGARSSVYAGNGITRVRDYDDDSEVDELFEIILEGKQSSSTVGR